MDSYTVATVSYLLMKLQTVIIPDFPGFFSLGMKHFNTADYCASLLRSHSQKRSKFRIIDKIKKNMLPV